MVEKYNAPFLMERADPWVYKHIDGMYYFTGSVPDFQSIELRRANSINELGETKEIKTIWKAHETGNLSELIWAPELHYLRGAWYIYFAAADHSEIRNRHNHHRMFVLENTNEDPFKGEWVEKGQIKTQFESFSIDATVFELHERLYYVWAQQDPRIPGNSNLYISEMENPWTLTGYQTLLSIPEYSWEKIGFKVNEGPAVIIRNGKVFITYSASATDENYAIGLLWADIHDDLLNGFSWHKISDPIFKTSEKNQLFGPGHNSFTVSEDGDKDILIYHARPTRNESGDPLNNPNRHAHAQIFTWSEDGFPIFGEPGGQ
ncbi:glycoside hydrolase family 43 protein [Aerococcaceae bacterium zg-BR9]|uniref:glycoside hydrolase family 43 protein n=1 Tax=Aerococcaceae bacterium zg-1292 TaxID=2774330 RepID=UPI0040646D1F|nr:glycoside hydrolase family 43 protein [Aerococcaceae bacterium zg-BR9]